MSGEESFDPDSLLKDEGIPTCAQVVHRENPLLKDPTNAANVQPGKAPYGFLTCLGEGKEYRLL